ncbi:glycosyltransferase family 39 protein [Nostoc sp. LEGE 06077]|uniref:glycosyltransferase family 39 protein n=1 Tax=Nostoc sp. LEGE 06077 TaxID=915325 RepID=UPI0018805D1C|nr:glycosyltransferase family 39 protein [Nostoc sp. LEGE 06077]MBE9209027.1 glycosyltransferase family 39 protein [Nostoc sp. LEGE 06077]
MEEQNPTSSRLCWVTRSLQPTYYSLDFFTMKTLDSQHHKRDFIWLKILVICILLLGIYFRFANLDHKVYWTDEVYTSLWLSGHSTLEIIEKFYNGAIVNIDILKEYQQVNIDQGINSAITRLALEDSQHPPLYYYLAWLWSAWLGNSVAIIRSLSAIISVFSLVGIYYLCQELFKSRLTSWISISLIAISPFHILYAQEAREYSLWTLSILISNYSLLLALRKKTFFSWVIYTITLILSFYTFLFSIFVPLGHGIYILVINSYKLTKTLIAYILSLMVAIIAFLPWLIVIYQGKMSGRIQRLDWITEPTSLPALMGKWLLNITRLFLDWMNINENTSIKAIVWLIPLTLALLILIGYGFYYLCRSTPKTTWLFLLTFTFPTAIALIIPDILFGGRRSGVARYLIPTFLGIQLTIAHLLASKLVLIQSLKWQKIWRLITIFVISCGVISCVIISSAGIWWNKGAANNLRLDQVATVLNQTLQPVVVSDAKFPYILGLTHLLNSDASFQLTTQPQALVIPKKQDSLFLFYPSRKLYKYLRVSYNLEPLYLGKNPVFGLWKLQAVNQRN